MRGVPSAAWLRSRHLVSGPFHLRFKSVSSPFNVRFVSVSPSLRGLPANGGSYILQRAPYAGKLAHRLGPCFQPPVFQALGGSTTGRGPQYREAWPVVPRAVLRGTAGHGPRHFPRTRPITFPCPSPNYPLHLHQTTDGNPEMERKFRKSRQFFRRR